jgi:uncharacterized protein (DUF2461 family)
MRRAIVSKAEQFLQVEAMLAKSRLKVGQEEALKRLPRGFEDVAAGPIAECLKLKSFVVHRKLSLASVGRPKLVSEIADFAEAALPLLRFGWAALEPGRVEEAAKPSPSASGGSRRNRRGD